MRAELMSMDSDASMQCRS